MITLTKRTVRGVARWCVDSNSTGKRERTFYTSKDAAEAAVSKLRQQAKDYGAAWLRLSGDDRAALISVWNEVNSAGKSLRHVWDEFRKIPEKPEAGPLAETVLSEMLLAKRAANRRPRYLDSLESTLNDFLKGREKQPIDQFAVKDVEAWIGNAPPWTARTMRSRASTLFRFAMRRGYVTADPCTRIEPITIEAKPAVVLTLDQCHKALEYGVKHPQFLPWLILGLFCGLRPEEADGITWQHITKSSVLVDAAASKVRQRRVVPMNKTATAWLNYAKKRGAEIPLSRTQRRRYQRELRGHLGWRNWPKDVLRHTAASYLLARHNDAAAVSLWLGHSERVLFRHYREVVSLKDCRLFWRIMPPVV